MKKRLNFGGKPDDEVAASLVVVLPSTCCCLTSEKLGGLSDRNAAGLGDEAIASRLWLVSRGVLWMYGRILEYAVRIEDGVNAGHVDGSAISASGRQAYRGPFYIEFFS